METLLSEIPQAELTTRFLDVGAFHPKTFSNTRFLVEKGWSGTYVEPAPANFAEFLREYHDEPQITLVNAALDLAHRMLVFNDSGGDALGTTTQDNVTRWSAAGVKFRPYWLMTISWYDLFEASGTEFSVLSLDTEGTSAALLLALPLENFPKLRVIAVEHDGRDAELVAHASKSGFAPRHMNGENLILSR